MTLFNPVFNCLTPIVIKRLKTQADEGLTTADEAGYVVLRQPPASKLANLFRIDVRDHALGLVTQQLGGRVTEHPPGGWLGPRTPSLRSRRGSAIFWHHSKFQQERPKTGLTEMMISGQCLMDTALLHDNEGQAISHAPFLVASFFE